MPALYDKLNEACVYPSKDYPFEICAKCRFRDKRPSDEGWKLIFAKPWDSESPAEETAQLRDLERLSKDAPKVDGDVVLF
jgi:hypothetical protein